MRRRRARPEFTVAVTVDRRRAPYGLGPRDRRVHRGPWPAGADRRVNSVWDRAGHER